MIRVCVQYNEYDAIASFDMQGHAEAGPHGQDIVCAGVSAVSIGTVNAIHTLCDVDIVTDMTDAGGHLMCRVPEGLAPRTYEDVQLLLKSMVLSLQAIADVHQAYMTVEIDRR
ncbi:ribosomal-processing cysteine protease Prp [Bacillus sp. FSL W7-1360]